MSGSAPSGNLGFLSKLLASRVSETRAPVTLPEGPVTAARSRGEEHVRPAMALTGTAPAGPRRASDQGEALLSPSPMAAFLTAYTAASRPSEADERELDADVASTTSSTAPPRHAVSPVLSAALSASEEETRPLMHASWRSFVQAGAAAAPAAVQSLQMRGAVPITGAVPMRGVVRIRADTRRAPTRTGRRTLGAPLGLLCIS